MLVVVCFPLLPSLGIALIALILLNYELKKQDNVSKFSEIMIDKKGDWFLLDKVEFAIPIKLLDVVKIGSVQIILLLNKKVKYRVMISNKQQDPNQIHRFQVYKFNL